MASAVNAGTRSTRRGPAIGRAAPALGAPRATTPRWPSRSARSIGAAEPAEGERRLLLAVLEDGIRTLLKHAGATRGRARTLAA